MLITGNNSEIMEIINKIKNKYKISNCQKAKYILGITIERINQCYYISQQNIIENLLKHFHITNIKKANTPCTGDNKLSNNSEPFDPTTYKSAIGSLIYNLKTLDLISHLLPIKQPDIVKIQQSQIGKEFSIY